MDNAQENKKINCNLLVSPINLDFGCLMPNQAATMKLHLSGGPGQIEFSKDHFSVKPQCFPSDETEIEICIASGSNGELIWDEITVKTDTQELTVPVTARWGISQAGEVEDITNDISIKDIVSSLSGKESPIPIQENPTDNNELYDSQFSTIQPDPMEPRQYCGRICSRCGKNFSYDVSTMSWEECHCSWYEVVLNLSRRTYKDLRFGVKEIPSYLQEIWQLLLGKETL